MEVGLTQFLTALGSGGLATLLTIATKFYLDLRKTKQEEGSQKSTSTAAEWTKTSEEWSKLVDRLSVQISAMQTQTTTLIKENSRWQVENEYLRGELRVRDNIIKQLRGGMPGSADEALIVSDENDLITQINNAAALLFHYSEEDLIGKPAVILIPERLRAQHTAGMRRAIESKAPIDSTRVLKVYGLTREGEEIPIDLQLTSWTSGNRWFCGAAIRRRVERLMPPAGIAPEVMPKLEPMKAKTDEEARQA